LYCTVLYCMVLAVEQRRYGSAGRKSAKQERTCLRQRQRRQLLATTTSKKKLGLI